jgi:MFS family permease
VVFLGVGGALGEHSWRTPFWLYLSGLIFLPLFAKFLWSPTKTTDHSADVSDGLSGVPWKRIGPLLIISLLGAIVFYALQIELSFVLDDLNYGTGPIGASAALANLGLAIAAVCFGIFNRGKASAWLVVGMFLAGFGLFLMALGGNWLAVTGGAIVAGVGGGLILPALLVGTTSLLRFEERGRGTGARTRAFYLGQFISPIVVNGLKAGTGELTTALKIIGVFGVVLSVACYLLVRRTPLTTNSTPTIALAAAEAVEPPLPTFEAPETEPTTVASTVEGSDADVVAEAAPAPDAEPAPAAGTKPAEA